MNIHHQIHPRIRRAIVGAVASGATVLLGAGTAAAHVDPDPIAVAAGSTATVAFGVEHGCDDSPTVAVAIKVPDGVTDAAAVAKDGWLTDVANGVVSFTGGSLDTATPDTFAITFTAPAAPGTVFFPVVQTCTVGELAWIEVPVDGGDEPDHPAPALLITDGPPTPADLTPGEHGEETATAGDTATTGESDHHAEEAADDDNSTNTAAIVAVIAGIVLIGGAGAYVVTRRRTGTPSA